MIQKNQIRKIEKYYNNFFLKCMFLFMFLYFMFNKSNLKLARYPDIVSVVTYKKNITIMKNY